MNQPLPPYLCVPSAVRLTSYMLVHLLLRRVEVGPRYRRVGDSRMSLSPADGRPSDLSLPRTVFQVNHEASNLDYQPDPMYTILAKYD
jgi:hypothetical protein